MREVIALGLNPFEAPCCLSSLLDVPRGVWKPSACSISGLQSIWLWAGLLGASKVGQASGAAAGGHRSPGQGDYPCPGCSHEEGQEEARPLPSTTEGTEAPVVLELPLSTYPVCQCQHSLGTLAGNSFLWATLSAEEHDRQFCSETGGLCETQGDKKRMGREEEGSEDPTIWERASPNSFTHQAVASCLPGARF